MRGSSPWTGEGRWRNAGHPAMGLRGTMAECGAAGRRGDGMRGSRPQPRLALAEFTVCMAVGCDQNKVAQMRGYRSDQHLNVLSLFFADALADRVVVDHDSLRFPFRFLRLILPKLRWRAAVQDFMVHNVIFRCARRAMNHENLVKRCASSHGGAGSAPWQGYVSEWGFLLIE